MYDSCLMCVCKRGRDLAENANSFGNGKLAGLRQSRAQRVAADERHCVIRKPVGFPGGKEWHDVRMLELSGELDLAAESIDADGRRHFGWQNFHHDLSAESGFVRNEHARHAAAPELVLEDERVAKRGLQLIAELCHPVSDEVGLI